MSEFVELSKEVSYALRHSPAEYGLVLDAEGWVGIQGLLNALKKDEKWANLGVDDLFKMIAISNKKRHEIVGNKIRALYGHSLKSRIRKELIEPPEYLYHGTVRRSIESIKEKGLLPQKRQYVHLSIDKETAYYVGKRRDKKPIILKVKAKLAWENGVSFYEGNDKVWLVDYVKNEYIIF